jgi:hypothetical protein
MEKETFALIELGGSHEECLYSQVLFLKKYDHRVHIILFKDHFARMEAWPEVDVWHTVQKPGNWLAEWVLVRHLLASLKRQGIRHAVLNTAEGNIVRKLCRAAGRYTGFTGIIHLSSKLWTSRSQRIISRQIRKYFVLADFIRDNVEKVRTGVLIESIYPIYFPSPGPAPAAARPAYRICIPGAVDFARRDYSSLVDEMLSHPVPAGVQFILLGRTTHKDGQELLERIMRLGLEKHFTFYSGFIPHGEFYDTLREAWMVLPLITPRCPDFAEYRDYKITGSFNLAYGFRLPMLLHESFSGNRIYRETSVFYKDGGLFDTIRRCQDDPHLHRNIRERISRMPEFQFDYQAQKYVQFIFGNHRSRP